MTWGEVYAHEFAYMCSNLFGLLCMIWGDVICVLLRLPKQQVDVTQGDDGDIQSESIDGQLAKGSHLMMGISKEKSLRIHHQ